MNLTGKDLCAIIKQCGESKVKTMLFQDFQLYFGEKPELSKNVVSSPYMREEGIQSPEGTLKTNNAAGLVQPYAEEFIDDPVKFEQNIIKNLNEPKD